MLNLAFLTALLLPLGSLPAMHTPTCNNLTAKQAVVFKAAPDTSARTLGHSRPGEVLAALTYGRGQFHSWNGWWLVRRSDGGRYWVRRDQLICSDVPRERTYPVGQAGLPVLKLSARKPGCYVACYSNHAGVYQVDAYGVHGLLRVPGSYEGTVCQPQGHVHTDISANASFKDLCNQAFDNCHGGCWAGGDTGGFGLD